MIYGHLTGGGAALGGLAFDVEEEADAGVFSCPSMWFCSGVTGLSFDESAGKQSVTDGASLGIIGSET